MLHTQHAGPTCSLQRRCLSYQDLASHGWPTDGEPTQSYDSSSESDGENPQPIKRSRSDQSLSATAQLAAATAGRSSSGSGGGSGQTYGIASTLHSYGVAQQLGGVALNGASYPQQQFARTQRVPSLPVVLSDVGSSTNSLISLDSEATRSASQQHLNNMQAGGGFPESPVTALGQAASLTRSTSSGTAEAIAAAISQVQGSVADGSLPHAGSRQHSSSGFVCSLNPVSSAASLTQAQLWVRGYDLTRTTSDASLSSGGFSAALQQLGLPMTAYSPPPLLSPGPVVPSTGEGPGADAVAAAVDPLGLDSSTAGAFKPGLSIQQQKQASFQGPSQPAASTSNNVVMTAALGSSSWGMRAVNSRDSLHSNESITSVEAGERLAGVRFGLHYRPASGLGYSSSPSQLKQAPGTGLPQLPPLSPPYQSANGSSSSGGGVSGGLAEKRSTSLGNLGTASLGALPGSGGSSSNGRVGPVLGRPPVPAGGAGSPATGGLHGWGASQVTSPGLMSEPSEGNLSTVAGASPAIELQSMGSVLGGDGQWLLGDLSTGAIGALSPDGVMLRRPASDSQQQLSEQHQDQAQVQPVGHEPAMVSAATAAAAQRSQATVSMAAPVPVSMALPAVSSSRAAPTCSLPLMPGAPGSFGFGFGAAPAGAAAAAAAAKQCLFDSAFSRAAAAGSSSMLPPQYSGTQSVPPDAHGAFGSFIGGSSSSGTYGRGVSAPLLRITGLPGRSSICGAPGSAEMLRLSESMHQPYRPSQHDASQWSFNRRGVSLDYARTSLSSRRRGSLELNMPWRKTLDAAIAKAAAESGPEANNSPCSSTGTDSSRNTDADTAVEIAASEAEATFGSGAVVPLWQRHGHASQLDLLMPLPEADDESPPSPCMCGPGSIGPGSMISGGRDSYDGDVSSPESSGGHIGRTSSSGNSIAADHDLPGSTNIGGYIGGSDVLGLARHSLDSPTAAAALQQQQQEEAQRRNSYGLDADDTVVMEAVALDGSPLKPSVQALQHHHQQQQRAGSSASSLRSAHKQQEAQEQVKVVMSCAEMMSSAETGDSSEEDDESSDDGDDAILHPPSLAQQQPQQQQQQGLAGKRSAPEASRKAAAAAAAAAEVDTIMRGPPSALGVDGPMPLELHSCNSASSISSRGSPGFYNRRGAGNGASRDLELFVRLNRARQTLDFAKRQAQTFAELDKAEFTVWEALDMLDGLREYEAGLLHAAASSGSGGGSGQDDAQLTPDMPLKEHAFQVAELCRLSFPGKPWMALVGLLHGLGKLLAHPLWGSQPQWAVAGESFPVGCKFAPQISASEFFSANPDRRRRTYSTAVGVYQEQCGLRNVYMSWGAAEYLYMLLVLNQTQLPEEALFMIRYQRCYAMTRPGGAYRQLMSAEDRQLLATLAAFQNLLQYRRMAMPPDALQGQQLYDYYNGLVNSYLGEEALFW